ncbi:hypothetical protein CL616_00880 [archaeon]|nr:hypothetical protein [archaeon]|tara:strand:+ start:657 stop:944 length:288 start_codon:yes stop_codon:yes gene_type:complete
MEEIKDKLRNVERIIFTKHAKQQIILRESSEESLLSYIRSLNKLVYFQKDGHKYNLYFALSNERTIKLPVVFEGKTLYILTYVLRYRSWQRMVKK